MEFLGEEREREKPRITTENKIYSFSPTDQTTAAVARATGAPPSQPGGLSRYDVRKSLDFFYNPLPSLSQIYVQTTITVDTGYSVTV